MSIINVTPVDPTPPKYQYQTAYYVSVMLGKRASFVEKTFRCINCGALMFKYYSDLHIIFDGLITDSDSQKVSAPIDIMCKRCKIVYRIL